MGRDRSFPEVIRRDGGEAPCAADEVIYERDPLGEGKEARAIDEVIHGEPAPSEETS